MGSSERYRDLDTLRADAQAIFAKGLDAACPAGRVVAAFSEDATLAEEVLSASEVCVVAFGKAACRMADAVAGLLRTRFPAVPWRGLAVVNRENSEPVEGVEVLSSGHPFPDEDGVRASLRVVEFIGEARSDALVLVLVSGGGSAILPSPADGIDLVDKLETTNLLLGCGAMIAEINAARKHLSVLKGGGLARVCGERRVRSLILSDVIGDDLSTIASGPTVGDPTSFEHVKRILQEREIWERVPERVRLRVGRGVRGEVPDTPMPDDPLFDQVENRLIGSNSQSLEAAMAAASDLGYRVEVLSDRLTGEARVAGARFVSHLGAALSSSPREGPLAILAGGETTVTIRGHGKGGRNQEMALAVAMTASRIGGDRKLEAEGLPWVFLSQGTDGIDGPTDAAGAIVDSGTVARGLEKGQSAEDCLARNDSYTFLEASGDLVITGASGTNVADLQILLVSGSR